MIEANYWWDEATKFKALAGQSENVDRQIELLDLAETCEAIAVDAEDRATGG
jgi:hypothetical protein